MKYFKKILEELFIATAFILFLFFVVAMNLVCFIFYIYESIKMFVRKIAKIH